MRFLLNNSNEILHNERKISKSFALLPRKCYDIDSKLEFIVWLEPIRIVYAFNKGKWKLDHYLTKK